MFVKKPSMLIRRCRNNHWPTSKDDELAKVVEKITRALLAPALDVVECFLLDECGVFSEACLCQSHLCRCFLFGEHLQATKKSATKKSERGGLSADNI